MAVSGVLRTFISVCLVGSVLSADTVNQTDTDLASDCQEAKLDMVFVLDSSNSVSDTNFELAKSFITDMVQTLPVRKDAVRVALVRFGNSADVISTLRNSTDVTTVTDAIASTEHVKEGTNTAAALEAVSTEVYATGDRQKVQTVIVIITDGQSENLRETKRQARKLREMDAKLVWVYIGTNNRALMYEKRVMERSGDKTFSAESFDQLGEELRLQVLGASCKEDITTTTEPSTPTTTTTTTEVTTTTTPSTTTALQTTAPAATTTTTTKTSITEPLETTSASAMIDVNKNKSDEMKPTTTAFVETSAATDETTEKPKESVSSTDKAGANDITTGSSNQSTTETETSSPHPRLTPTTQSPEQPSKPDPPVATDAVAPQNQTYHPESSPPVSTVSSPHEGEEDDAGSSSSLDGSSEESWQEDWITSVGIGVGVTAVAAISTALVIVAWRRCKQNNDNKAGHDV